MSYRKLPTESDLRIWLCDNVITTKPLYIPNMHHNAFTGCTIAPRPVAILDEETVLRNLLRTGLSNEEAIEYLFEQTKSPAPGWPLVVRHYQFK
jgi:hypothetical protein